MLAGPQQNGEEQAENGHPLSRQLTADRLDFAGTMESVSDRYFDYSTVAIAYLYPWTVTQVERAHSVSFLLIAASPRSDE